MYIGNTEGLFLSTYTLPSIRSSVTAHASLTGDIGSPVSLLTGTWTPGGNPCVLMQVFIRLWGVFLPGM